MTVGATPSGVPPSLPATTPELQSGVPPSVPGAWLSERFLLVP
jgi:hypothetical protein